MDQVLGIPEVLRSICNELGKKDCLASALTCRALLEPSLDSLWHTVGSFEPFIHCLPVVTYITCAEAETFLFLTPSKKFTRGHLERYLTFYAHRIRHFVTPLLGRPTHRALSTDFLLAVQLLTNNEPGILSPLLRRIDMHHPSHTDKAPKFNLSAFLSLFLGNHVESFSFPPCKGGPIYTASVHANLKRLSPRMKRLRVLESIFIDNVGTYISPYSWDALEVLQLYTISPDLIHLAATLPQLQTLEVYDTSLVHTASQDFPLTPSSAPSPSSFASLRSLLLATKRAGPSECRIFDYLPEQNRVEQVKITSDFLSSAEVGQALINAVSERCNPTSLKSFILSDEGLRMGEAGPVVAEEHFDEADCDQPLDISPLYQFSNVEVLTVRWCVDIRLSPEDVSRIPAAWPRIRHLDLCPPQSLNGRVPPLNHTHLLQIANACPSLRHLGLRFDTTQLAGRESDLLPSGPILTLRTLRVGDSPISSPSRVVAFIKGNFPKLEKLDVEFESLGERPALLERRWAAVVRELGIAS